MHTAANPSSFVKMAIFDMDNTLLHRSFIHTAAEKLGFTATLERIIAEKHPAVVRTQLIAQLLKGRTQEELVDVVRSIPIVGDAATVIGSLMGLGQLAASSELSALRALGQKGVVHMVALLSNYTMTATIFHAIGQQLRPEQTPLLPVD